MKLVLDTNIIHGDFHLQGARITKLCNASTKLDYELMTPEVVFDEVVDQFRRELEKHWTSYEKMLSLLGKTKTGSTTKDLDKAAFFEVKIEEYKSFLTARLEELGISIIPYPEVDIKALVAKEQLRKKPFKEVKEHSVGLRDALIWETIKSLCVVDEKLIDTRPQVEFLTENTLDFAEANGSLHSDLVKELEVQGLSGDCVSLISNTQEFFKTKIDAELEELDSIKNALLTKGRFNRFELEKALSDVLSSDYLDREVLDSDFDSGDPRFLPHIYEDPSISGIGTPITQKLSVRKLDNDDVLIEVEAVLDLTIDFFVYTSDYFNYLVDDKAIFVIDWNWNEHYLLAQRIISVIASLSFRMTPSLGKVLSSECSIDEVRMSSIDEELREL